MEKEIRRVIRYADPGMEACYFRGLRQPFPPHFHKCYVIVLMERGCRQLLCQNRRYTAFPGDLLLFAPGEAHGCTETGEDPLSFRAIYLPPPVMGQLAEAVLGQSHPPAFSRNIVSDRELAGSFRLLHDRLMAGKGNREALLPFFSMLLPKYGCLPTEPLPEYRNEVEAARRFMEARFAERLTLEQIGRSAGLSKSTLLRAFTKTCGITPYRYLETLRIEKAKALLERGVPPAEAAMRTGFSDQSHFTRYFTLFTGVSPGAYRDIFLQENRKKPKKRSD